MVVKDSATGKKIDITQITRSKSLVSIPDTQEDEVGSVVDSESDSDTDSAAQAPTDERPPTGASRKRKLNTETEPVTVNVPDVTYQLLSNYEERLLLRKLDAASRHGTLPPHVNRFQRKLIVRQLQRENGLPVFDLDAEMNKLAQVGWGPRHTNMAHNSISVLTARILGLIDSLFVKEYDFPNSSGLPGNYYHGDMRVLDKFQMETFSKSRVQTQHQPSFLNRLVGYEDDQLHSICSPYTSRILKPFIRRDYESRPFKLKLLEEIKAYPHRNDPTWTPDPSPPIDYCYVRPQHIPSVNTLCREFFWPGIDLSECLQYPDFSCVVLFRKIVIGFGFMVPDVKQNEAYISFIFTHSEWRRANIATFMLYHLIQTCMGKDVTLHCSATNNAMLLYQRFGFKPEEFILDFYDKYFPADTKDCKHAFFLRLRR